jgi:hypothetical protein
MNRRRSVPDPLKPLAQRTWLITSDMLRNRLDIRELPPHADLLKILSEARELKITEGWSCDEIGRCCSFFFAIRGGVRIEVGIQQHDPAVPLTGHSTKVHFRD